MFPPVFDILQADAAVTAIIGNPPRAFDFGEVVGQDVTRPYVVYQSISGDPYNTLFCPPDTDIISIQVDVYATDKAGAKNLSIAVRKALEASSYMISGPRVQHEEETRLFRVSMDFDFHTVR